MTLTGCKASEKIYTIAVISSNPVDQTPTWPGFYESMAESGYIEGKNLKYIIKIVPADNNQKIKAAIEEILNQNPDIICTWGGNNVDLQVKESVEGGNIPVLFGTVPRSVLTELVESISYPGGNMTGVQASDCTQKTLEILKEVVPGLKRIFLPYNPDDQETELYLPGLNGAASKLGIELVTLEIHSVEEAVAAIENSEDDIDAVFMAPSPTLNFRSGELTDAAIKRRLPTATGLLLNDGIMITYAVDFFDAGKKMARMAREIFKGAKPADIPVETMEVMLIVNLNTAEKVGVHIPDDILVQADKIIR